MQQFQQAKKSTVDALLNNAAVLINNYQVGDETLSKVTGQRFSQQLQKRGDSQDGPLQTLNVDHSVIKPESPDRQVGRELIEALAQQSCYDTLEMQKPPENVPASLLKTFDIGAQLPQNKFVQEYDAEDIIRKYAK